VHMKSRHRGHRRGIHGRRAVGRSRGLAGAAGSPTWGSCDGVGGAITVSGCLDNFHK